MDSTARINGRRQTKTVQQEATNNHQAQAERVYDSGFCHVLRRSFRPPLLIGFPEGNKVIHVPEPIRNASGHRWGHANLKYATFVAVSKSK